MKIEAGAGTGKTTAIVEQLLLEMMDKGTDPHKILALTFTVKAAAEMRDRLRRWLRDLLDGKPIKELPGFAPDEEALRRGRDALPKIDQMEIGTIHSFAGHLLRLYPVEAGVPPDFDEDDGAAFDATFAELWDRWIFRELESAPLDALLDVADLDDLGRVAHGLCAFGTPLEVAPEPALGARRRDLADEAREKLGKIKPTLKAARAMALAAEVFEDPERGRRREHELDGSDEVLKAARKLLEVDDETIGAVVDWLRPFVESFRREYLRRGHLSFDGMIHYAIELLRGNPEVRQRLSNRFARILVDEFQDTDPLQGELIRMLARDDLDRLTIVGDPRQSIYLFRGADVGFYREFMESLPGEVSARTENWRSRPAILDFVHEVFPKFGRLECKRDDERGSVELLMFEGLAKDVREAEAEQIASMIEKPYRNTAMLFRALTDAHLYVEALRRRGIDFAIEGGKYFYEAPEVTDFVNLLRAIIDPADAVARAGYLRSPLGGLSDRELLDPPDEEPVIAELRELAGRLRIDDWVREIFRRLPVLEVAAATYRGEQAVANLERLYELAVEDPSRTPAAFIRECSRRIREEVQMDEGALADEQLDVVRILSIHKAKGLEFHTVFLPDLHRKPNADRKGPAIRRERGRVGIRLGDAIASARFLMDEAHARKEAEERERLLYVAMTRARERLVLTGAPTGPYWDLIAEHLDKVTILKPSAPKRPGRPKRAKPPFDPAKLEEAWRARESVEAAPPLVSPSSLVEKRVHVGDADAPMTRDAAATVGTIVHAALAALDYAAPSADVAAFARRYGPEAEGEARTILEAFFKTPAFAELARSRIVGREVPFVRRDGNGVLTGQMDLLIDRGAGIEIVDFKTDRTPNPEAYRGQGEAYSRALGGAPFALVYVRSGEVARLV